MRACLRGTIFAVLVLALTSIAHTQTSQSLQSRIPKPDPKKYQAVRDAKDWKNPILIVLRDGIEIRGVTPLGQGIPVESVAGALERLPNSAWPYGLVVIVQENGVRARGDSPSIEANRKKLLTLLTNLGITPELWPSA